MRFEQALIEMRKGKKVTHPGRKVPLMLIKGYIVTVNEHLDKPITDFSVLYNISTRSIIRNDWEVLDI